MIISVINHTNGRLEDSEVQHAIRAINRQISKDFSPYWGRFAAMRLEGTGKDNPDKRNPSDMRGNAVIYLWDKADTKNAIGYHDLNHAGIPYGFVFVDVAEQTGENWTVTLSHEALELIGDPEVNLLAMGPHPVDPNRIVFHWYEMCDAVQTETYEIDGVEVSNFVLPLYFTTDEESAGRNDFLGSLNSDQTLRSFGVNPGGYVGFYDPQLQGHDTFSHKHDGVAAKRMKKKFSLNGARRGRRYQRFHLQSLPSADVTNTVLSDVSKNIVRIESQIKRLKQVVNII